MFWNTRSNKINSAVLNVIKCATENIDVSSQYAARREISFRQKLAQFLKHRVVEYSVIVLIILFSLLVLVEIVLDDGTPPPEVKDALDIISYVELTVVVLFLLEVCLKVFALGFSV